MLAWKGDPSFCYVRCNTDEAFATVVWELAGIIKASHSGLLSIIERRIQWQNAASKVMGQGELQSLHQLIHSSDRAHKDQQITLLLLW